jgi:hypothetical protein
MQYDITGPVTINETKSLMVLLAVLILAGSGLWAAFHYHKFEGVPSTQISAAPAPIPSNRHMRSSRRRPVLTQPIDSSPNAVIRSVENPSYVLVKSRGVYVTIFVSTVNKAKSLRISRTYPRGGTDDLALAELWETARAVNHMIRDPAFADTYYNVTPEQFQQLAAIPLRLPRLTGAQQRKINDLFLAAEGKKGQELAKADKALQEAVGQMPIAPGELEAMADAAADVRALLRPDQLDLIDSAIDRFGMKPH